MSSHHTFMTKALFLFTTFSGNMQIIGITYKEGLSMLRKGFAIAFANLFGFVHARLVHFVGSTAVVKNGHSIFDSVMNLILL